MYVVVAKLHKLFEKVVAFTDFKPGYIRFFIGPEIRNMIFVSIKPDMPECRNKSGHLCRVSAVAVAGFFKQLDCTGGIFLIDHKIYIRQS